MTRLFAILFALLAFAATLVRADPPFISGGDSAFVPGVSAVQIGGDLYQPATLTLDGVAANAGAAATTVRAAAATRGSRAARAGRKMLDDAAPAQQATTEQPQQSNGNTVIIQGEEYVKSDAPLDVQKDLKATSLDEEGKPSSELAAAEAEAASAAAAEERAAAATEHEGADVEAATGRAPAQRVGDRRIAAGPAHHHDRDAGALLGGGGGEEEAPARAHGEGELPRRAFKAHSEEVQRAHGAGAASKHSPLASKQPPVVDVGMQNKQMDSRRAHAGVLQGRKGA